MASDLGLHCLPMSLLYDAKLKQVNTAVSCFLRLLKLFSLLYMPFHLTIKQNIFKGSNFFMTAFVFLLKRDYSRKEAVTFHLE